jgi:thiol-disulfide isomerase/thioredoxin
MKDRCLEDIDLTATPRMSRRAVIGGLAGAVVAAAAKPTKAALLSDGPPLFETARQQFNIVRPARRVPDLPLTRIDGSTTNFTKLRGKVVLLNFWATWCPACRVELPILDRLQRTMGGAGLQVIAVSTDRGDRRIVERFAREMQIRHLTVCHDPENRIAHTRGSQDREAPFALYGMPISYVINRSGGVEGYMTGEADWLSEPGVKLLEYYLRAPTG